MDAKRSAGVALEVNLRNSSYTDKQGGSTVTKEPRIDIRSLNKRVPVVPQKDSCD